MFVVCVARVRERRGAYRVWWGDLRERDHVEDRRRWKDNIKVDFLYHSCRAQLLIERNIGPKIAVR
jgi:hypothetical protein